MTGTPSQTDHVFTIGELSRRADCNIETVRYYERIDIMPQPARNSGGHRLYDEEALKRLVFVRRCRALGFTLDQVRDLLHFVDRGDYTCADVKDMTVAHRAEMRRKITDLERMDQVLADMAKSCEGGRVPECPIIDALFAV